MKLGEFVKKYGKPCSKTLGIDLSKGRNEEIVKWFLASILYGKPIREGSATKTYRCFKRHGVLNVESILKTGWEGLVSILDEGGYTRYDFSTADKLLEVFGNLKRLYKGDMAVLYDASVDARDLEAKLMGLGKGMGETTISIFLRDMRVVWSKADPRPSPLVRLAMKELGVEDLKAFAEAHSLDIMKLETALLRLAKDFIRKGRALQLVI